MSDKDKAGRDAVQYVAERIHQTHPKITSEQAHRIAVETAQRAERKQREHGRDR